MVNKLTEKNELSEQTEPSKSRFQNFFSYIRQEIVPDFKRANEMGIPFFITRGIEVNYFFIIPSVSTLGLVMLIFVPLHRFPTESVLRISAFLIILANMASLIAVALWRWLIERHYKEAIEKRRREASGSSLLNSAARFASPFLTPDNAHPARHLLGLWAKDNLVYILPSVILVALFPPDIAMLDPVMDNGISSLFSYIVLFTVMANLLMFCAIALFYMMRWGVHIIRKITRLLSGASYLEHR